MLIHKMHNKFRFFLTSDFDYAYTALIGFVGVPGATFAGL